LQTPAPFEYERATSVDGAIAALKRHGSEARVIAGGHSLLPMMKLRLANPEFLVDINDLSELAYIREDGGEIRIGALTRHVDLLKSELLARHYPLFRDAEEVIADPVVRNRGTIGGSLCQADAAEDLSAVCTAAKGRAVIRGASGERVVSMDEFHVGPYMTAVGDGELLTELRLPLRPGAARGRLGDSGRLRRGVDERRRDCGGRDRAQRGGAHHRAPLARGGAAARQGAVGRAVRPGGGDRVRGLLAHARRPRAGGLQAPPRWRTHQARAAARGRTCPERGGLMQVSVSINGETVSRDVEPRQLLVHFIRETPGLTGTHWGCDTSNCGACVVLMDGKPVKSCTTLAAMCMGHEIRTVESLEVDGQLDPVQMGFHELHGLHCGFCTPGMLMTARALLDDNPDPTEAEIRTAISGQICRCTGYKNIVGAVRWAAEHEAAITSGSSAMASGSSTPASGSSTPASGSSTMASGSSAMASGSSAMASGSSATKQEA